MILSKATTNFVAKLCPFKKDPITKKPNTTIFWKKKGPNSNFLKKKKNQGPTGPKKIYFLKIMGKNQKPTKTDISQNQLIFNQVSVEIFKNWPIWFSPKNTQNWLNRTNYTPTFLPPPPSLQSPSATANRKDLGFFCQNFCTTDGFNTECDGGLGCKCLKSNSLL